MGISLSKMETQAPDLVNLYKTAAVSLEKKGLTDAKAAVYLVLDHSGSMSRFYQNGDVQTLAEQALGLSANLDDDGTVPVIFFDYNAYRPYDIVIGRHQGAINAARVAVGAQWGGTNYAPAMQAVVNHYQASGATDPAFVIFETDGRPGDASVTSVKLREFSSLPIFWQFVGFGPANSSEFRFLQSLDELSGCVVDNAGFFAAGDTPRAMTSEAMYHNLINEYPTWLTAARAQGIIR